MPSAYQQTNNWAYQSLTIMPISHMICFRDIQALFWVHLAYNLIFFFVSPLVRMMVRMERMMLRMMMMVMVRMVRMVMMMIIGMIVMMIVMMTLLLTEWHWWPARVDWAVASVRSSDELHPQSQPHQSQPHHTHTHTHRDHTETVPDKSELFLQYTQTLLLLNWMLDQWMVDDMDWMVN